MSMGAPNLDAMVFTTNRARRWDGDVAAQGRPDHDQPRSAIDAPATRHPGCVVRRRIRTQVEDCFGAMKTCGGVRTVRHTDLRRVASAVRLHAAVGNLVWLAKRLVTA